MCVCVCVPGCMHACAAAAAAMSTPLQGGLAYLMLTGSFKVYCNLRTEQRRKKRTIEDCLL